MFHFNKALPEQEGIHSEHIMQMITRLESLEIPMHSILIVRNDQLLYEGYFYPYDADKHHRMFSISKTLTAIAVGHLITLGKLHLDDCITDYFPEKCPKDVHPWIKAMTIRNMLEMRTCHSVTTYKHDLSSDWVASFFHIKPDHPAGTVFHYDTSSPHVLCALVEKLTGKSLYNYVREDIMPELDLSVDGFMLPDPFGVSAGGSGLCCKPMDLMKIGYFLLHNGNINGRQIIDADYLANACGNLNPTVIKAGNLSESYGYGYQIWRHGRDGYAAYGMGGQYILVCPKENTILVTTADTQGYGGANQMIHEAFFEEVLDKIRNTPVHGIAADQKALQALTAKLSITPLKSTLNASVSDRINGTEYRLLDNPYGFTSASLSIHDKKGILTLKGKDTPWNICFGLEQLSDGRLPVCDQYYVASGAWISDEIFYIKCHICDTSVGNVHIQIHFKDSQLTIFQRIIEETLSKDFPAGHFIGYME